MELTQPSPELVKAFLNTDLEQPVGHIEMGLFWLSCSPEEQLAYTKGAASLMRAVTVPA